MNEEVKRYLRITWDDEDTDNRLTDIINRAIQVLQNYAGSEIDFETNLHEKQLLFDCIRYIWNDSLEEFKVNFKSELFTLRAKYRIAAMEEIYAEE